MTSYEASRSREPRSPPAAAREFGHVRSWTIDRLRERSLEVPVLVLTTFGDDELVLAALRAGARGYLLEDVTLEQLARAVRTLEEGGTLVAPSITDRLLRAIRSAPQPDDTPVVQELTERELEVLRLMAEASATA